ncbi:MAG: hypothetical protein IPH81_10335 [Candidatus Microthrix sp.]|jgi:hypothetical protein|uniref:Uncharacterized protein n=1 Tax=Candidatus Neomicrothrix subdominans TaxID=2954438 RepID=A0A936NB40_9ACTN|nr:hypothetical protein [Candidatus Microthrix sp.]MBK9295609.1 hypothetical protein [Candidatus Microthrix subdominans]MBK6438397.1 hypothetical protein [Candidatus Microthrix sp.]MBK7165648.1 hypothetical protein [Candidatus Microthrix sp.]MBK9560015.1 hypothetical protein [Candidatus Microthrix sp.]MBP7594247.1 hypothetical protein [Candidatus Microthrix sp.]
MVEPAVMVTVPGPMLERAVEAAVGDGFVAGTVVRTVSLPMIDSIEVGLTVTIVGAYFDLVERADARVPVRVHGRVTVGRPSGEPLPISLPPLDVEVSALVEAQLDLGVDQVRLVIDLPGVEFLGASVIGVEGAAPSDPMAQMAQMALAETGDTLFSSLGREVGPVGMDLTGIPVAELGLSPGRAVIRSTDGALTVTIGGVTGETASAHRTPPSREDRIGVSIDADLLGPVLSFLATRALGGIPAPFDLDLSAAPGSLSVGVRNTRVLGPPIPDFRTGVRTAVHLTRRQDHLEVRLAGAWLELPGPLGVFDGIGRAAATLGASVMPIVARLPISYPLPNVDDLTVRIASLAVGTDRIDAQLEFVDTDE